MINDLEQDSVNVHSLQKSPKEGSVARAARKRCDAV